MKKLATYLFLFFFSFLTPSFADDVRDIEIEGIRIGDSLLDFLSREEIINEIEINKPSYNYLTDEFGEVYIFAKFNIYERMSFFVKPKDKNFTIYSVNGSISYDDKLDQCLAKQKELNKEFSLKYKNTKKSKYTLKFPWDTTGESVTHNIEFNFDRGHGISISCTKYKKSLKIKNGWEDSFQIKLDSKEVINWFNNPIN